MDFLKYDKDPPRQTSAWSNFTHLIFCRRTHMRLSWHPKSLKVVSTVMAIDAAALDQFGLEATGHFWWLLAQSKLNHGPLWLGQIPGRNHILSLLNRVEDTVYWICSPLMRAENISSIGLCQLASPFITEWSANHTMTMQAGDSSITWQTLWIGCHRGWNSVQFITKTRQNCYS